MKFNQTKILVHLVLTRSEAEGREELHQELKKLNCNEGRFYDSIIHYWQRLVLTADERFDLLCKLRTRALRKGLDVKNILSEEQLKRLPRAIG